MPSSSTQQHHQQQHLHNAAPLYDLFLDLPHPQASPSCPGPFLIDSPSSDAATSVELHKNLLQIVRFAFPEYDESNPTASGGTVSSLTAAEGTSSSTTDSSPAPLNRYDVYALSPLKTAASSFTFSLQLSSGVRVHGHVRRYLPPHMIARTRYDVGRRGERALCILTRATGADLLYSSILKTVDAISSQQAALSLNSNRKLIPHNNEPQKWFLHQLSRYQQHLSSVYGTKPGAERGKPLIASIPCVEIGDEYHSLYKDVDVSRFIIPTTLLVQQQQLQTQQNHSANDPGNTATTNQKQHKPLPPVSVAGGSIVPLLRCVGVVHTIRIMAALLSERRVVLVSGSPTRLATCSNAALSMMSCGLLYWQHLYIPVLPPHLWQYLAAPYPYLIGILSSAFHKLDRTDGLGEVLIIHLDTNQLETRGMDVKMIPQRLPDIFLRPTAASYAGGGSNHGYGTNSSSHTNNSSSQMDVTSLTTTASSAPEQLAQDLFDVLRTDKKILYGVNPTNSVVNALVGETAKATMAVKNTFLKLRDRSRQYLSRSSAASGMSIGSDNGTVAELGSGGGSGEIPDDAVSTSGLDSNTTVNTNENSMASDYIYTEGCHNETSEEEARIAFTAFFLCLIGDVRWYLSSPNPQSLPVLDRTKFLQQKRSMGEGEGTPMFPLLTSFCQSQMLEEFAKARIEEIRNQSTQQTTVAADMPLFLLCTSYHRQHHIDFGILNVKRIVRQIAENNPSGGRLTGMLQTNARRTAMALTSTKGFDGQADAPKVIAQLVDQCRECTSILFDVMSVIWLRLRDSKGMLWKHALQALLILRNLLYHGPLAAITEAVDGLDKIRALKYYENIRPVSVTQVRNAAASVYELLVDRARLFHIRRACLERRRQLSSPISANPLIRERNARIGVPFRTIHASMNPSAANGTVVTIPPKPVVATQQYQQQHQQHQQYQQQYQSQQQAQRVSHSTEVDFFDLKQEPTVPPPHNPTSAVSQLGNSNNNKNNDDVLDLFGSMAVTTSSSLSTTTSSVNPFDIFSVPVTSTANSTQLATPAAAGPPSSTTISSVATFDPIPPRPDSNSTNKSLLIMDSRESSGKNATANFFTQSPPAQQQHQQHRQQLSPLRQQFNMQPPQTLGQPAQQHHQQQQQQLYHQQQQTPFLSHQQVQPQQLQPYHQPTQPPQQPSLGPTFAIIPPSSNSSGGGAPPHGPSNIVRSVANSANTQSMQHYSQQQQMAQHQQMAQQQMAQHQQMAQPLQMIQQQRQQQQQLPANLYTGSTQPQNTGYSIQNEHSRTRPGSQFDPLARK